MKVYKLAGPKIDAFVFVDEDSTAEYYYGGTRTVGPEVSDEKIHALGSRLCRFESRLKNALINHVLAQQLAFEMLPPRLAGSLVGGARCILRPHSPEGLRLLGDRASAESSRLIDSVFATLGRFLNDLGGTIKLTPDFGRFAELSDNLHRYSEHVLGIRCAAGGCGGKSSYTTTGILEATRLVCPDPSGVPLTVIGAAGALGCQCVESFLQSGHRDLAVSDLAFDDGTAIPPDGTSVLRAQPGSFTDDCLSRGGLIIATTVGDELDNCNLSSIPNGTLLILAHNLAIPLGDRGYDIVRYLHEKKDVLVLPGQVLTLGGALTSRLEWFFRQANPGSEFGVQMKATAHRLVRTAANRLTTEILNSAQNKQATLHESMLSIAFPSGNGATLPAVVLANPIVEAN